MSEFETRGDVLGGIDLAALDSAIAAAWSGDIEAALVEYISKSALSPHFDPDWAEHGVLAGVVDDAAEFVRQAELIGAEVSVLRRDEATPLLLVEVAPFGGGRDATVLLYGHLDKQPEMTGWRDGFCPWNPVLVDEHGRRRLYGRGGADDGYALYGVVSMISAIQRSGGAHGRLVVMIETSEESGSPDLGGYVELLDDVIGSPELVICLDSGAADDQRLWLTTSLRGLVEVELSVSVLTEGVHSGEASGVVPSSFRIVRGLLDRVERVDTGEILVDEAFVDVPGWVLDDARACVDAVGETAFPWFGETRAVESDPVNQLIARTWKPSLSVVSASGLPEIGRGGNVLRPSTALGLSFRVPPGVDSQVVAKRAASILSAEPPYGATVTAAVGSHADGWAIGEVAPWLAEALSAASTGVFGQDWCGFGEGGSIPFMAMLGRRFPQAQFVVTGVLVPGSNAHGPNESLDLGYGRDICRCVARVLHGHAHLRG